MTHSWRRAAALVVVMLMLTACSPGARDAGPLQGVWAASSLGLYLDVHGGDADLYESSSVHCALVYGGTARGVAALLEVEDQSLTLTDSGRVLHFSEIATLPESCLEEYRSNDPRRVVDVAAATIEELYRPAVDDAWGDRLDLVSAGLGSDPDPVAAFAALTSLLSPLRDPGVRLVVDDPAVWVGVWSAGEGPFSGREPYQPRDIEGPSIGGEGGIVTGRFGGVGYVGLARLGGFAEDDEDGQRVLAAELDSVLRDSAAVILDLRGSSSGRAVEAMLIASRFVSDERVVATQMLQGVPAGEISVRPTALGPFAGPVVVLVGPGTAGAAEMLLLALRGLPGVITVGEPTAGSPTPPVARYLPNGWTLGVPALDLVTPDNTEWSGRPIIPEVAAPTSAEDLNDGADPGLTAALELLG